MKILIAGMVLMGIALVFAVLLTIFEKKLKVAEDPRIEEIIKLLSGANCGGCGYAGCKAFARAIIDGGITPSACPSISPENKDKISEVSGKSDDDAEEYIYIVSCFGGSHCKDKYSYQGYGSCQAMELLAGGKKACSKGCIGMSTCTDICLFNAVKTGDAGVASIDQSRCVQCGLCVKQCPKNIIRKIPKSAKVYLKCSSHDKGMEVKSICSRGCIGCGICSKICPEKAISIENNIAVINYKKCSGCLNCIIRCPVKCIVEINHAND